MAHQAIIDVSTRGRGTREITAEVARIVAASGIATGVAHVFNQHTSLWEHRSAPHARRVVVTVTA
ncbi:MAG: YjbQ family protein [Rhodocyclales bacterium]|nr:YjbQ family protein [Rhodocyclales bacterium]